MRVLYLIALLGCGRVGFDPHAASPDASPSGLVSVDPRSLPPFGAPVRVDALSLAGIDDDDPCLTRDQLEIFFDSTRPGGLGQNDIFTSRRASLAEPWSAPVPVTVVNSPSVDEHPQISGDGLTLYFTSERIGTNMPSIWKSTRPARDAAFSAPELVRELDTPDEETIGAVAATDTSIVYTLGRIEDLYEARRADATQPWGPPIYVTELNTAAGSERGAHVDDRALVIYYEQDGLLLWSVRDAVGEPWSPPQGIAELETAYEDSDPWLSPDLRTIYFVRDIPPEPKDIFMATR